MHSVPVLSLNSDPGNIIKRFKLGYKCNDIDDMAKKITFLIKNKSLRDDFSRRSFLFSNNYNNINNTTDKYEDCINGLSRNKK